MSTREDRQDRPTSPMWECNLCLVTRGVKCARLVEVWQGAMRGPDGKLDRTSGSRFLVCAGCLSEGITTIVE